MRIAITGAGAGGLFAALLLARRGHDVAVFEQERFAPAADVEAAAASAYRPTAPQIVQPYVVMARCRQLLRERLPDVYERLLAAGVVQASISDWMPDTLADRSPRPGDERLSPLLTRRSTLDWVLQQAALDEPGVTLRYGVRVVGLVARPGQPPRVTGLRTDQGQLRFDLVIDACGRRTPLDRWLHDIDAPPPLTRAADSGVAYFSRHYRVPSSTAQQSAQTTRIVAPLEEFTIAVFGADNGAMQLAIVPLSTDRRFRRLHDPDVFTAVLRTIPACDTWLRILDPVSPVFQMTGPRNTLRRLVVDAVPIVIGLHAVGDSVCTTNPTFGRGLSLAMWGATDLTDVIDAHADDTALQAITLDQRIEKHVAPYYEEQAAVDANRLATLRHTIMGDAAPAPAAFDPSRVSFTQLRAAASYDPSVFRAFWTLMFMLATPDEVYRDPRIVACTTDTLRARGLDIRQPRGHLPRESHLHPVHIYSPLSPPARPRSQLAREPRGCTLGLARLPHRFTTNRRRTERPTTVRRPAHEIGVRRWRDGGCAGSPLARGARPSCPSAWCG
jgi:2-polyprenyl-6-methoxyphenol hydroxylase-like FAD-dependent oxidoreductase